jgi:hypothetical protein
VHLVEVAAEADVEEAVVDNTCCCVIPFELKIVHQVWSTMIAVVLTAFVLQFGFS